MIFLLIGGAQFSCRTTRYVASDEYLLNKIEIDVDAKNVDKKEIETYLRQKENLKILGFAKFHLWLFNLSSKKKENGWFKRIGEAPVIYDEGLKNSSKQQFQQYMFNKGYYNAVVNDSVLFRNKKADVIFSIESHSPYLIRRLNYQIKDKTLVPLLSELEEKSLVKEGDFLDVDVLDNERSRITKSLKNKGYYNFADEYIHYKIDTSLFSNSADIEMIIEGMDGSINAAHRKYKIANFEIFIDNPAEPGTVDANRKYSDTTRIDGYIFYHNGQLQLNEALLIKSIEMKPGEVYSKAKEEKAYNNLYSLRQFKYVNIQYDDFDEPEDTVFMHLVAKVYIPLQTSQSYSFDIEGTNTSGNLGIAGNLNYQHKNIFDGGQILDLKFRGARERQLALIDNERTEFNMRELGGESKITIPGIWFPIDEKRLSLYAMPSTRFSMSYNFQERPDYTRTIASASFGYNLRTNSVSSHYFNPLELNAVRVFRYDSTFVNSIKDLFIKSSYTDHVISSSVYSYTFNKKLSNAGYRYFRANVESSGNILAGLSRLFGRPKYASTGFDESIDFDYYQIFNTRFAQYVRTDFDYRYGMQLDKYNAFAFRTFFGLGLPYGNFHVMPFEKKYFTGGANGIRAWQVRSLGPGSYVPVDDEYPTQSGDIKLEANLEYRFKLFWVVEGALFLDAGNVWAINKGDNRPGAVFEFNRFYKEIALGTGAGIRLVSSYFIVRTDLGIKLRDPALPESARWIAGNRSLNRSDLNFNIGIGYPF